MAEFLVSVNSAEKVGSSKGMTKRHGVLILTPFYEPNIGGVETHLKDLVNYLNSDGGYKVFVLTYQPITTKAKGHYFEEKGNLKVLRIPWIGFNLFHKLEPYPILEFFYITPWLLIWTFIFLLFKSREIDVIHAQGFNASFIAKLLINVFRKRFIISTHAVYEMNPDSLMARMVKWTLKSADKILTLSEASKRELVKIGLDAGGIDTYTYWIEQEIFKPISEAKKKAGWGDMFIVLFVGRFIDAKGTDILLESAERMKGKVHFAFIGDGPLSEKIEREAGILNNVIFIGKVENRNLPLYYSAADILCVPSKYEEGFGRVILEAISCGTPVIASNKGGIPEAVDSSIGVLVEPKAEDFYKAILYLFENREELEKKKRLCRGYAVKRFGKSNAVKILSSYKN